MTGRLKSLFVQGPQHPLFMEFCSILRHLCSIYFGAIPMGRYSVLLGHPQGWRRAAIDSRRCLQRKRKSVSDTQFPCISIDAMFALSFHTALCAHLGKRLGYRCLLLLPRRTFACNVKEIDEPHILTIQLERIFSICYCTFIRRSSKFGWDDHTACVTHHAWAPTKPTTKTERDNWLQS